MKEYLRLFLSLVFFTFVLNVAQAKRVTLSEDILKQNKNVAQVKQTLPEERSQAEKNVIPEGIAQAHEAVWKIVHSDGHEGTAFFIGPNQVVSYFHSITSIGKLHRNRSIKDLHLEQGYNKLELSKILKVSAVNSLVVFETKEKVSKYLNISKEKPSGRLFALGYSDDGVKRTLIHSEEYEIVDNKGDYSIALNKTDLLNLVGGPVLNNQEEVVGVTKRVYQNISFTIKSSKLEELQGDFLDCSNLSLSLCVERAIKDLTERAEQDEDPDPKAQCLLADMYQYGRGVPQDLEKAIELLSKSAQNHHPEAQSKIAVMYLDGYGVAQDFKEAVKLMFRAANQGYVIAQNNMAVVSFRGIVGVLAQDSKKAIDWWLKSANQGYAPALYGASAMYSQGRGVPQDLEKAIELLSKSAEQGYAPAQKVLEEILGTAL